MLKSDIKLFAAALSLVRVYVVQPLGEDLISVIDYDGTQEKFSPELIKINGSYFFREQFEFRVDAKKET
ncbi:hypothetical protein C5G87_17170 [Paenibacillus peoriae]|uniref:hypothetical protein n=1 Tax=Paenibacillus peoriae TaxID=59893 RepID=UPI000CEC6C70|nr:hypothetical protein [Paenibacillus peoriae]PPQ47845.1 hypothetical protein C5G87_17170 [Paenibacillus peoriae]